MSFSDNDRATQYESNGFLVVENLLSAAEVDELSQRAIDIAEDHVPGFPRENIEFEPGCENTHSMNAVRKLNGCAEHDDVFLAHAKNNAILDIVETLIGPDIKLFGSQMFVKPPGGVQKPYHQDSAYFTIEPMSLVTCWIALDDVTIENGCLWVIPGSHRNGVLDHSQPWQVGNRTDMQIPDDEFDRDNEVPIIMPAGSCSFHHSLLLHRSGDNRTKQYRRGLAMHYMSSRSHWTSPDQGQPEYLLLLGQKYDGCV